MYFIHLAEPIALLCYYMEHYTAQEPCKDICRELVFDRMSDIFFYYTSDSNLGCDLVDLDVPEDIVNNIIVPHIDKVLFKLIREQGIDPANLERKYDLTYVDDWTWKITPSRDGRTYNQKLNIPL